MKKIIFLLVFAFISLLCFAGGDGEVVEVPMTPNSLPNRGQASMPIVDYSTVNNSGTPTVYYVNLQPSNTYTVTISSANDTYYGILAL